MDTITQVPSSPNPARGILWLHPLCCAVLSPPFISPSFSPPLPSFSPLLIFEHLLLLASLLACVANFFPPSHTASSIAHQPLGSAPTRPLFLLLALSLGSGGTYLAGLHGALLHGAHGLARKMFCCRSLGAPLNLLGLELSVRVCVSFPPRLCGRGQ